MIGIGSRHVDLLGGINDQSCRFTYAYHGSDGTLSPQALVNAVLLHQLRTREEPVLRVIAVTDHDSLAGAWTAMAFQKSLTPKRTWRLSPEPKSVPQTGTSWR
jgi:hypothetical protein